LWARRAKPLGRKRKRRRGLSAAFIVNRGAGRVCNRLSNSGIVTVFAETECGIRDSRTPRTFRRMQIDLNGYHNRWSAQPPQANDSVILKRNDGATVWPLPAVATFLDRKYHDRVGTSPARNKSLMPPQSSSRIMAPKGTVIGGFALYLSRSVANSAVQFSTTTISSR
jgi:hypothetical protein